MTLSKAVPEDGKIEVQLPKWITSEERPSGNLPMVTDEILKSCQVRKQTNPTC